MYNSNDIAEKIKERAKSLNISIRGMLLECELGPNTITAISNGRVPRADTLAKIADYLNCSTDYLLGLTDEAEKKAADISADSPDPDTQKAIDYLNFIAEHDPEALQKAAEYAKFLLQDKP